MPRFIPSATLLYMAGNLDRRAAQHDAMGDEIGAIKYRRLADQCRDEASDGHEFCAQQRQDDSQAR